MESSLMPSEFRNRIVHFDLKGAPLKLSYFERVLQLCKGWGATGILLEWEDTFPYCANLVDIGSQSQAFGDGLYSVDEVQTIFRIAKCLDLEVIQLVQTIGHMEFVLKHPSFKHLRELPLSPAVLCPSKEGSRQLVRDMLDQALAIQPDAQYLHIGADEVWHMCVCDDCVRRTEACRHGPARLYLEHVRDVAAYLRMRRPRLRVLLWDDMLRSLPTEIINEYRLGELVQPVVWHYGPRGSLHLPSGLWSRYSCVFPTLWAASAYKGAASSRQMLVPTERYLSNQEAWIEEKVLHASQVNFTGIILTGWSRFDHFATLCELLPLALPTLMICLKRINNNYNQAKEEEWPGRELAQVVEKFAAVKEKCTLFLHGDLIGTWLNPWQIENNYTNPMQVEGIAVAAAALISELLPLEEALHGHLLSVTGARTTAEWMGTHLAPVLARLRRVHHRAAARAGAEA